jgi:hypothetical protein
MSSALHLDGSEPIADDEMLYRRIPVSPGWYNPAIDSKPLFQAFRPRPDDLTGLSVLGGGPYNTVEQAAQGSSKSGYYVLILRAGDLRAHGIDVVPRPIEDHLGHAEISNLTAANRDSDEAQRIMELLAEKLCLRVEEPFHG